MSFKEQLKTEILPKAIGYYNDGSGINEAIVKAASDFNLNVDQTDRLLETMNTARTIAHYEKNAEDRTSNFDIADKQTVHRMLFEDKPVEKKASASGSSWFDYSSYDSEERDYNASVSDGSVFIKAAEENDKDCTVKAFTEKQVIEKTSEYVNSLVGQIEFAREREGMVRDIVATLSAKTASDLSRGYEPEENIALFKLASCKYPEAVKCVLGGIRHDYLKSAETVEKRLKKANVLDSRPVEEAVKSAEEIQEALKAADELHKIAEDLSKKESEARKLLAQYNEKTAGKIDFFGCKEAASKPPKGKKDEDKDKKGKKDPWTGKLVDSIPELPTAAKSIYDYVRGSALDSKKIDEIVNKPKSKSNTLREYVNNMRRSDIISELYEEDPILSEASPEEVSRAYSTLVQTSPEASLNKEVVRAILRQSVNSVAVSPFDAKQWADLDKTLLENKRLASQIA